MRFIVLLAAGMFVFLSCAGSPDAYAPIDAGVRDGSYEHALASLNDEKSAARKTIYTSKNEILLYLDRGIISHYAGLYNDSSRDLETAERLIEEAFTKSITQEIGTYILNDNTRDYSGEDYEDLYTNVFNSLNYYHRGDLEGAMVEIRRLNEKLQYLADKYERAKKKVLDSNEQIDAGQYQMEASKFSNSALARYMGMLLYRSTGRADSARIDYEELLRAYELAPGVYYNAPPSSLDEELSVPEGMGRLNVIAFTGLSPVKVAETIFIPLPFAPPNNFGRISIPKMVDRTHSVLRAEVVLDSGKTFNLELIEDMGEVARETFKDRYGLVVFKTVARIIVKNTSSAVAAAVVSEKKGEGLGLLVGLVGKIFTEASEQADTRLSRCFPRYALVGGINLEPGHYGATVNFYGSSGLLHSRREDIVVRENTLNLLEFVYLK